jgi:hypothetical protein
MDDLEQIRQWYASEYPPSWLEVARRLYVGEHKARRMIEQAGIDLVKVPRKYAIRKCCKCCNVVNMVSTARQCEECRIKTEREYKRLKNREHRKRITACERAERRALQSTKRKCAGYTIRGVKHKCDKMIYNYRCDDCWSQLREGGRVSTWTGGRLWI